MAEVKERVEKTTKRKRVPQGVQQGADGVPIIQLATRIPKDLYRTLKLYAVENDAGIGELVAEAIGKLLQERGAIAKAPSRKAS